MLSRQVRQDHPRLRQPPRPVLQHRRLAHLIRPRPPRLVTRHPMHEIHEHVLVRLPQRAQQERDLVTVAGLAEAMKAIHGINSQSDSFRALVKT